MNAVNAIAATAPKTEAVAVFSMMTAMRRSVEPSVEPGLNPIQPNRRMKVPVTTKGLLCPGLALGEPFLLNLPMREPNKMATASAHQQPVPGTSPDQSESTRPVPRFERWPIGESERD